MRLEALYFIGALAVTAIPLSAGAQSLPANDQPTTTNAQAANPPAQQCPPDMISSLADIPAAAHGALRSADHAAKQ